MFNSEQASRIGSILLVSLLILVNAALHSHVYGNRNFREDEIVVIHAFKILSATDLVRAAAHDIHPPGWRLLGNVWIKAFGIGEEVTRWLSKLTNLFTFALLYQFGKHLSDKRAGMYAVVFLGLYGFASNAMYELRPYPMLIMLTTALHLLFYRWLHKPSGNLALCYCTVGIAVIYTHFFSFFVFPAHAVCLLIFRRYERKLWLNSLLMWACIGASFLGWLLPFLQAILVVLPGGIYYGIRPGWLAIGLYYTRSKFQPELIYQFLSILSLFAAKIAHPRTCRATSDTSLRFSHPMMLYYPLCLLLSTLVIAYCANMAVSNFSQRNVVMLAPLITILMALGLRLLPTYAAIICLVLLYLNAPQNIAVQTENGPYREIVHAMSASYTTDSIVLTEFDWAWRWLLPVVYYVRDFTPDNMPMSRMFHTVNMNDSALPPAYPEDFANVFKSFGAETFEKLLPQHKQLWHVQEGGGNNYRDALQVWLNSHYALIRTVSWEEAYFTTYSLSEYARVPAHQGPILAVGEHLRLYSWELQDSVQVAPCQAVNIESWWQTEEEHTIPLSISIILADEDGDGQLAITNSVPADQFTIDWLADKYYRDQTTIVIPCNVNRGRYDLLLAAKESMTGKPLELAFLDGNPIGTLYYLTTLYVEQS